VKEKKLRHFSLQNNKIRVKLDGKEESEEGKERSENICGSRSGSPTIYSPDPNTTFHHLFFGTGSLLTYSPGPNITFHLSNSDLVHSPIIYRSGSKHYLSPPIINDLCGNENTSIRIEFGDEMQKMHKNAQKMHKKCLSFLARIIAT
jgi:hypothetical protein